MVGLVISPGFGWGERAPLLRVVPTVCPAAMRIPLNPANFMDHFVSVVLSHAEREYPNKLDHVINDPCDLRSPQELHPVFFGSFDWHSCVHGHWLIARALRMCPGMSNAGAAAALLDRRITPANVAVEVEYLRQPRRGTFERTYGWGWLLKLAAELHMGSREQANPHAPVFARWSDALAPLAAMFVERYLKYLPKATYPIRVGTHMNSAFGLALALDYAAIVEHAELRGLIAAKARGWYSKDENCPAWEPDGVDFLSPALMEAECMRRVLDPGEFAGWFDRFLPRLAERQPAALFTPAIVSDHSDAQITHLNGLNLSRAWCWKAIAQALPRTDPRRALGEKAFDEHLHAALPFVTGDYMGEHWLATFAMLAMTE